MDRSYLSDQAVVAASRDFVCARLLTFEDGEEAELMKRLYGRRQLVNTVFTILDPKGRRALTRTGRSPRMAFADADAMAEKMRAIARRYPGRKDVAAEDLGLPVLKDVRLALNVTECDAQQLVVVRGEDKRLTALRQALVELSWSDKLIGRFLYAQADGGTDWGAIKGAEQAPKSGVLIVRSDPYGLTGEVVACVSSKASAQQLRRMMLSAAAEHAPRAVDTRQIRRKGMRDGKKWRTELPSDKRR